MKIPYAQTSIPPGESQGKITGLLYEHGAEATRWTTEKDGTTILEFIFDVRGHKTAFRVVPPILKDTRGKPHTAQSMRLLYWWLKSQMEAVKYGLTSVEEAFLAHVVGSLPSGEQVTMGDVLLPRLRAGEILGPSEISKALPPRSEGA